MVPASNAVASSVVSPAAATTPAITKKRKIYCDKWIHDGTCAFTQIGCKFKHEMPLDRETQLSVGLNHGLPVWFKRAHGMSDKSPTGGHGYGGNGYGNGNGPNSGNGRAIGNGGHSVGKFNNKNWRRTQSFNSSDGGVAISTPSPGGQYRFRPY